MPHEAVQAPTAGAPLQYVTDSGHDKTILTIIGERYWTFVQMAGRRVPIGDPRLS